MGKADAYISGAYTQPCVSGGTFQKAHLDNWTPENPGAKYPRLSYTSDLNKKPSTFWMADASYCRLKNLQLSYTFPSSVTKALRIHGLMVYANATNLFTISNYYDGYDPETAYQGRVRRERPRKHRQQLPARKHLHVRCGNQILIALRS